MGTLEDNFLLPSYFPLLCMLIFPICFLWAWKCYSRLKSDLENVTKLLRSIGGHVESNQTDLRNMERSLNFSKQKQEELVLSHENQFELLKREFLLVANNQVRLQEHVQLLSNQLVELKAKLNISHAEQQQSLQEVMKEQANEATTTQSSHKKQGEQLKQLTAKLRLLDSTQKNNHAWHQNKLLEIMNRQAQDVSVSAVLKCAKQQGEQLQQLDVKLSELNSALNGKQTWSHEEILRRMEALQSDVSALKITDIAPSKHICGVLAHTLRKLEDIKTSERVILDNVSRLQANLKLLSNGQTESGIMVTGTENSTTTLTSSKIPNQPAQSKKQKQKTPSSETLLPTSSNSSVPSQPQTKKQEKTEQKTLRELEPATSSAVGKPQPTNVKKKKKTSQKGASPAEGQDDLLRLELFFINYDLIVALGPQVFASNAMFSEILGGNFKGAVVFSADKMTRFFLRYVPLNAASTASQFFYSVKILSPCPRREDWLMREGKMAMDVLKRRKMNDGFGFELTAASCDKVKQFLSEKNGAMRVVFTVQPC